MLKTRLAIGLGGLHLSLLAVLVLSTLSAPVSAQGTNAGAVVKPNRSVGCPSGWKHPDGDTSLCAPQSSSSPRIYGKAERESCAAGYHEVYRVWCSTRRP